MPIPLIIAAVGAAASVGSAALGASKADKERYIMQQLTFLNIEEKNKLENKLRAAKSEEERIKIIGDTLNVIAAARVKGISVVQAEKEKTKKQIITLSIIGGVVILVTILILRRK